MGFICMEMDLLKGTFLYEWFYTKTRCDMKTKGYSEMGIPSHGVYFAI